MAAMGKERLAAVWLWLQWMWLFARLGPLRRARLLRRQREQT